MANPQKQFNQAMQLHQAGRIGEAIDLYTRAMPKMKKNPQLLFLLGTAHLQAGRYTSCIDLLKRAAALDPKNMFAHIHQGNALQKLQRLEEAVTAYDRALALKPDLAEIHNNRGVALLGLGRTEEALAAFEQALALKPDLADVHNNRGIAMLGLGRIEQALASFEQALALSPAYAEAHNNRGTALLKLDRLEEALASLEQALALIPNYGEAHFNRGKVLRRLDRLQESLASFEQALTLDGDDAETHLEHGNVLQQLGRLEEALASYERALAIRPEYAEAHNNRGTLLLGLNRLDEALAWYNRALALKDDYADAYWNKAMLLILAGQYLEGWELYEWRLKKNDGKDYAHFPQPAWRGEGGIGGKRILIHGEQGMGDVIQFCRYLPQLRSLGAEVIFEAPKPLLSLISTMDCPMTLVARGEPLPAFDVHCPLMSLPHAFRTTTETIPAHTPYLYSDEDKLRQWQQRLGTKHRLRVGLVWSGAATHKRDAMRSIPLEALLPLIEIPAEWHSLQQEYRQHDLAPLGRHPEIHQHQDALHDFSDTAALIECMDLIISVDTSVAHMAGAMGKPVWVLLPFAPDFRWMLERHDSPWYPTARLFRQPAIGDWPNAIARVATAMRQLDTQG